MASYLFTSRVFLIASILSLSSCGYAFESSNQEITVLTPGAQNAYCDAYVEKLRYQIHPPQTLNIHKSDQPMILKCVAPGNRRVELEVPAKVSARAVWGSPAGMAWDYASKSLHQYPNVVAVDFSQVPIVPEEQPKHNAPDIQSPEAHDLEEIKASVPRLNTDKNKSASTPIRRDGMTPMPDEQTSSAAPVPAVSKSETNQKTTKILTEVQKNPTVSKKNSSDDSSSGKGSLMSIIERLGAEDTRSAEPAALDSEPKEIAPPYSVKSEAEAAPVPISPQ